jgi:halimadienyl-diphosphate synthase
MVRVAEPDGDGPRWPHLVDWLLEHQWPDGSWGGAIPYYHDRILCTLAAVVALEERKGTQDVREAIRLGQRYIWNNTHLLHHDPIELVGFELILPTLLSEARTLELDVPAHTCGYGQVRAAKLRLLPMDLLYEPNTSVAFSIEFMGGRADPNRLGRLIRENGAIANSPAATAYVLSHTANGVDGLRYLESILNLAGGVPSVYPFRTFEAVWVLEHLSYGGLALDANLVDARIWQDLQAAIEFDQKGVGVDPFFGINDGDTTSVTLHALAMGGQAVDPLVLHRFEHPETRVFRTFPFERNVSVVTNAHALEALSHMPDYPERQEVWDRIVTLFLASQKYQSYWIDKWHASPYYATAHVLVSLISTREPLLSECLHSIDWFLHTQRQDGSWGFFDRGTAEETAYVLLALLHHHRSVGKLDTHALRRGAAYLYRWLEAGSEHPELWIAKTLYAPGSIVQAAILAAAILYEDTFGCGPE